MEHNMDDDYDNHDLLDQQVDQEEQWFYHVLGEFEDCLDKYGHAFVLSKLSETDRQLIKEKLNV